MRGLAVFLMAVAAWGQGLPAEWEVRDLALGLGRQLELLGPALGGFATEAWVDAPAAYGEQRDSARREALAVAEVARAVAQKPRGLGKAFELQVRLQQIGVLVASLEAGARTYQPGGAPEPADLYASTTAGQAQLREYLMELATAKDVELETVDTEAQACRSELMKRPDPAPKPAALRVNRPAQAAVGSAKPAVPAKPSPGKAK